MTQNDGRTSRTWFARAALGAVLAAGAFTAFSVAPSAQAEEPILPVSGLITLTYTADASLAGSPATIVDAAGAPVAMTVIMAGQNVVTVPNTGSPSYLVIPVGTEDPILTARGWDDHDTGDVG